MIVSGPKTVTFDNRASRDIQINTISHDNVHIRESNNATTQKVIDARDDDNSHRNRQTHRDLGNPERAQAPPHLKIATKLVYNIIRFTHYHNNVGIT